MLDARQQLKRKGRSRSSTRFRMFVKGMNSISERSDLYSDYFHGGNSLISLVRSNSLKVHFTIDESTYLHQTYVIRIKDDRLKIGDIAGGKVSIFKTRASVFRHLETVSPEVTQQHQFLTFVSPTFSTSLVAFEGEISTSLRDARNEKQRVRIRSLELLSTRYKGSDGL